MFLADSSSIHSSNPVFHSKNPCHLDIDEHPFLKEISYLEFGLNFVVVVVRITQNGIGHMGREVQVACVEVIIMRKSYVNKKSINIFSSIVF